VADVSGRRKATLVAQNGGKTRFELLEHTADVLLRAHGKSLGELFENAALAIASLIGEPQQAQPREERVVELHAEDLPSLLVAWLNELLFLFETVEFFGCEFKCEVEGTGLRAQVRGERFNPAVHGFKTEIKAVTRHQLRISQDGHGWTATVLLDI